MAQLSPVRRRMIEDMTVRNMSPATQRFAKHCEAQDVPDTLVLRRLAKTHR